jgi:outer membrane protein assembly factor BamA
LVWQIKFSATAKKQLKKLDHPTQKIILMYLKKKIETGVFLLIKVEEYPRMETYILEGNDEIDESDLEKEINLIRGQILKLQTIFRIKANMKKLYDAEGFLNATIDPRTYEYVSSDSTDDEITVTWRNTEDHTDE